MLLELFYNEHTVPLQRQKAIIKKTRTIKFMITNSDCTNSLYSSVRTSNIGFGSKYLPAPQKGKTCIAICKEKKGRAMLKLGRTGTAPSCPCPAGQESIGQLLPS